MKIFVDSSIIVEYIKGNQTDLFEHLIVSEYELFTNAIVYSEFMFYYLAVLSGKSPLAVKENKQIKEIIEHNNPIDLFSYFTNLPIDKDIIFLSYDYMKQYNLLPNDALILSTVKINALEMLASYDKKDFRQACIAENIRLITSLAELK